VTSPSPLERLTASERMKLMQFVCSFAWTDLRVSQAERDFVQRLVGRFQMGDDERKQIEKWLIVPPRPEDVDPTAVPHEHRQLFMDAAIATVEADGRVPAEDESLALLRDLLQPQG